jgi:hypothetical protein
MGSVLRLEDLAAFFEKSSPISDPDTRLYIESMVWEYGGSPRHYMEIVELFERKTTEEDIVRILNNPEPSLLAGLRRGLLGGERFGRGSAPTLMYSIHFADFELLSDSAVPQIPAVSRATRLHRRLVLLTQPRNRPAA